VDAAGDPGFAFQRKKTYGEFLDSEEKIATNILADRLALLEMAGIISRHKHPTANSKSCIV